MNIVDTHKKVLSQCEGKEVTSKVCKYSLNSYSTFSLYSVHAMYHRFHLSLKQCLMLKSHIPIIDTWIGPKICYYNYFMKIL